MSHGLTRGFQGVSRTGSGLLRVVPAPEGDGDTVSNSDKSLLLCWLLWWLGPEIAAVVVVAVLAKLGLLGNSQLFH
jgi:hypothetical protein